MNNNLVRYLKELTILLTNRVYDILDVVVTKYEEIFSTKAQFDQSNGAFVGKIDMYTAVITKDLNGFYVKVAIYDKLNECVAEGGINVEGKYNETYNQRIPRNIKPLINTWFEAIADIDVEAFNQVAESSESETTEVNE